MFTFQMKIEVVVFDYETIFRAGVFFGDILVDETYKNTYEDATAWATDEILNLHNFMMENA